jgi:hypothetical protein
MEGLAIMVAAAALRTVHLGLPTHLQLHRPIRSGPTTISQPTPISKFFGHSETRLRIEAVGHNLPMGGTIVSYPNLDAVTIRSNPYTIIRVTGWTAGSVCFHIVLTLLPPRFLPSGPNAASSTACRAGGWWHGP